MTGGWVFVTKQLFSDGENMLVPTVYTYKRKTKLERFVCLTVDLIYYSVRAVALKTVFGV